MIVAFAFSTVALTAVIAHGWLLLTLRRSQDRIADRVEAAATRWAAKQAAPTAPTAPAAAVVVRAGPHGPGLRAARPG